MFHKLAQAKGPAPARQNYPGMMGMMAASPMMDPERDSQSGSAQGMQSGVDHGPYSDFGFGPPVGFSAGFREGLQHRHSMGFPSTVNYDSAMRTAIRKESLLKQAEAAEEAKRRESEEKLNDTEVDRPPSAHKKTPVPKKKDSRAEHSGREKKSSDHSRKRADTLPARPTPAPLDMTGASAPKTSPTPRAASVMRSTPAPRSRPMSGRPASGTIRRNIPSRKDSLLELQAGQSSEYDELYGKANDDDLEKMMAPKETVTRIASARSRTSSAKGRASLPPLPVQTSVPLPSQESHSIEASTPQGENRLPPIDNTVRSASVQSSSGFTSNVTYKTRPKSGKSDSSGGVGLNGLPFDGDDSSDEELKVLASQVDSDVYDPLASTTNLNKNKTQVDKIVEESASANSSNSIPESGNKTEESLNQPTEQPTEDPVLSLDTQPENQDENTASNEGDSGIDAAPTEYVAPTLPDIEKEVDETVNSTNPVISEPENSHDADNNNPDADDTVSNEPAITVEAPSRIRESSTPREIDPDKLNGTTGSDTLSVSSEGMPPNRPASHRDDTHSSMSELFVEEPPASAPPDLHRIVESVASIKPKPAVVVPEVPMTAELGIDVEEESTEADEEEYDLFDESELKKPKWHPPWQLKQEIIAHSDSIPVLVVDPTNRWFTTGSVDKTIKMWDINSGKQKLTIKAHKGAIRAMTFGMSGHRFLFTTSDDRQLLCHDIEINKVVSKYKDQNAVIYAMCIYQPSNLLITASRDKIVRIYDTRKEKCVKSLRGHHNTVSCATVIENTRQIMTGSHDSSLRIWDIGEGRCTSVLTGHTKSVRAMTQHPEEPMVISASTEKLLAWSLPHGECIQEIAADEIAINSVTINHLGVTVAGGSNGVIHLWDFKSGHKFQKIHRTKVYQSQEVPICVFATAFDRSGTKLICSDASNVVKIYREAYTRMRRRIYTKETDLALRGNGETLGSSLSVGTPLENSPNVDRRDNARRNSNRRGSRVSAMSNRTIDFENT